jgi:hypothetical protein
LIQRLDFLKSYEILSLSYEDLEKSDVKDHFNDFDYLPILVFVNQIQLLIQVEDYLPRLALLLYPLMIFLKFLKPIIQIIIAIVLLNLHHFQENISCVQRVIFRHFAGC